MGKKIFSGVQPTGNLHLGNYLGAIKNFVDLNNDNQNDCIFCVVDLHAITVKQDPKELRNNIRETVATFIACGIDYKKSIIFNQSTVSAHSEAALEPVREYLTKNQNLTIGLLGFGGAGKAISAFLLKDFKKKHQIHIFNRSMGNINYTNKNALNLFSLNDLESYIPHIDLLINATSAGHVENIDASPVSTEILKKAKKTMIVYDIIYDPIETMLLRNCEEIGLKTMNGLRMNLMQAVLSYRYTNKTILSMEEIYKAMN